MRASYAHAFPGPRTAPVPERWVLRAGGYLVGPTADCYYGGKQAGRNLWVVNTSLARHYLSQAEAEASPVFVAGYTEAVQL